MRSFEEIPRVPVTRLLGQIFAERRPALRDARDAGAHLPRARTAGGDGARPLHERLPVRTGREPRRLLDRADSLSSREPWMLIMGTIFPNGLLLRDGAEHRHHRKIMHEAFKRPVLREYVERMNPAVARSLAAFAPSGGVRLRAFDAFKALTLDIAASIFVGVDLGRESHRMNEAFEAMVAAAMPGPSAAVLRPPPPRSGWAPLSARAAARHAREEAPRRRRRPVQPPLSRPLRDRRVLHGRRGARPHGVPDDGGARHHHQHAHLTHLRAGGAPRVAGADPRGEPRARRSAPRPRRARPPREPDLTPSRRRCAATRRCR